MDLARRLTFPFEMKSVKVSSYSEMKKGDLRVDLFPSAEQLNGRTVILIDDICDSGDTLKYCADLARNSGAHAVRSCALLVRKDCPEPSDFYGHVIEKGQWVFGYGMDFLDNLFRHGSSIEYVQV
jgi:hypoxanthine-guanine phosphoribosyltransferase